MNDVESVAGALRSLDRAKLESLMLAVAHSHAATCRVASEEQDAHASDETMRMRVTAMSLDDLVAALAPVAALGRIAHEHHAEHDREHGH